MVILNVKNVKENGVVIDPISLTINYVILLIVIRKYILICYNGMIEVLILKKKIINLMIRKDVENVEG